MSKITMDVSEFKALEKNAELAEKYAESLKTAKEENERLQQQLRDKDLEKIKDLEDKSKSVVYIRKQVVEERKLVLRDKIEMLKYFAQIAYRHQQESRGILSSMQDTMYSREFGKYGEDYIHAMFETKVSTREFGNEVVERKNLDTVVATIREEEKQKIDAEVKAKLKRLETLEEKLDDADKVISSLKHKLNVLRDVEAKHIQQLEAHEFAQKKVIIAQRMFNAIDNNISSYNWFTAYKRLSDIHESWLTLNGEFEQLKDKERNHKLMNDL